MRTCVREQADASSPTSLAECVDEGWRRRSTAANEPFANQGLCIRSALEAPRNP